ncbi:MAG TPA: ABC transporter permease, partial [Armatimonadota bacterium]|nr:ABC transporter permease [Armatimonadota bacterium]
MSLWESVQVALEGLVANKMRAALTMLGIVIGVASVIAMLALGRGAREQTMQRIQQMGTNLLIVFSGRSHSGTVRGGMGSNQTLTLDDADAIAKGCPSVLAVAPEVQTNAQVKYKNQNTNTTVLGEMPEFLSVRNYQVQEGRFFTPEEVKSYRKVAVIGPTSATNLFGESDPVGQNVRIRGIQFQIVGLMKSKGTSGSFNDPDDQLIIPVTTAMRRVIGTQYVRAISVQAKS